VRLAGNAVLGNDWVPPSVCAVPLWRAAHEVNLTRPQVFGGALLHSQNKHKESI